MHVLSWDTETALFRPGVAAPELACVTWQACDARDGLPFTSTPSIAHHTEACTVFRRFLNGTQLLVGHNVAYDFAVAGAHAPELVPAIFDAYDSDRVTDTMIRQKLLDIAAGCYRKRPVDGGKRWVEVRYGLEDLTRRLTGRHLSKDTWRLYYGEFIGVPLAEWPRHALAVKEKFRPALAKLQAFKPKDLSKEQKEALASLQGMLAADPEDVLRYPLEDARATLDCFLAQEKHAEYLEDQYRQTRRAFWLHLVSTWGLRTNGDAVERLRRETERERDECAARLVAAGLVRPNGTRDTKAAAARMLRAYRQSGAMPRLTDGGAERCEGLDREETLALLESTLDGVSLDEDACKASGDEVLEDYALFSTLGTVLSKDVKALASGTVHPIHTRFDLAETGRTTSSKPNVQNWRRSSGMICPQCGHLFPEKAKTCKHDGAKLEHAQDIRACFVPRPGFVFAQADYDQLELRTLAQVCIKLLGHSRLAAVLNAGEDPHTHVAADILGIPLDVAKRRRKDKDDKEFDAARQVAKVANFGMPGGLGAAKLVLFAKKSYGVEITEERARELKRTWLSTWPEMEDYFAHVSELAADGDALVRQLFSYRLRGGCTYTAACNSFFQGLGADATGRAGWLIVRACYRQPASPLFGSRVVNYIHDEFIVETPDTPAAHDAAHELARLMVEGANEFLPDVPARTEPLLMRFWSKGAEPLFDAPAGGRLVPWPTPGAYDAKGKRVLLAA